MTLPPRLLLALTCTLAASCARQLPGSYACKVSSQCVLNGVQGVCEPTGACSFPDPACASGRRYGDFDPGGLAGTCVSAPTDLGSITPPGGGDLARADLAMSAGMISRVGSTQVAPAATGVVSLPLPTGVVAGDLLVAAVYVQNPMASIAAPMGWTRHADVPGGDFHAAFYYKRAGASEPSPIDFTLSGSAGMMAAAAGVAYRGVAAAGTIDASMSKLFTATPYIVPAIVTTHANDRLLAMFIDESPQGMSLAQPAGMNSVLNDGAIVFFDATQAMIGSSGDKGAGSLPGLGAVDVIALTPAP